MVVRTLDVGGDKGVPYYDFGTEANPFLGYRAIRISLDNPEGFKSQLRALLRAGVGHDLQIMFPMIAMLDEVRQAKKLFEEARVELEAKGIEMAEEVQLGIMVETPAVALLADRFAPEVDFFSIGTNDLTQYTFAAERGNKRLSHLNDPCHPAILRQIDNVVRAAHAKDKWVGVCGEMAGDPGAIPLLLGLGVDEFSMSPRKSPPLSKLFANVRTWMRKSLFSGLWIWIMLRPSECLYNKLYRLFYINRIAENPPHLVAQVTAINLYAINSWIGGDVGKVLPALPLFEHHPVLYKSAIR